MYAISIGTNASLMKSKSDKYYNKKPTLKNRF